MAGYAKGLVRQPAHEARHVAVAPQRHDERMFMPDEDRVMRRIVGSLLCLIAFGLADIAGWPASHASSQRVEPGDTVVLVTLDGARTEEVFGGLDLEVLKSTLKPDAKVEDSAVYKKYWADTPEARRRKILPFFWTLVTEQGSIAGNRALGSRSTLSNTHWFSYPGYSEILLGQAFDDDIKSNDPIRQPRETVLERLKVKGHLTPAQVATFASWDVFNAIAEHSVGATTINAGTEPLDLDGDEVRIMNRLQTEAASPWGNTRLDAFTFRQAMAYLEKVRPRVLYLAFDETDDWAHDGRYDKVLDTYARLDGYLRELWTWLQAQPDYRGRTHLLITTDHGRGATPADWRHHGDKYPGAEFTWMAFVSPKMAQRGEWKNAPPISTSQAAATLASWVDVDWNADHPQAGKPIR